MVGCMCVVYTCVGVSIIVVIARGGSLRFMFSPGARLVDLTVVTLYIQGKAEYYLSIIYD